MDAAHLGPRTPPLQATDAVLKRIADRMARRYVGMFARETVERYIGECHDLLAVRARVTTYLPVLAERFAVERLDALARTTAAIRKQVPEVLFVCTENAGRSQLASALLRGRMPAGAVHIHSAGTKPSNQIDPVALRLIAEMDLAPNGDFPKPLTREVVEVSDVVITVGCGDACPVLAGRRYLDWNVPDLKGLDIESARSVRDGLSRRIDGLVDLLAKGD